MTENITKLNIGEVAPNFEATLQNPDGSNEVVELYKLLETQKVLLVFYPGDDTPGCTKQLCGIRDVYGDYKKYNVKVLGVNQANKESHFKFIEKYNYPFGIIVDEDKSIRQKYGAIGKFFANTVTKRGVFLINEDKTIQYIFWGQQDNEKIFEILESKATN